MYGSLEPPHTFGVIALQISGATKCHNEHREGVYLVIDNLFYLADKYCDIVMLDKHNLIIINECLKLTLLIILNKNVTFKKKR